MVPRLSVQDRAQWKVRAQWAADPRLLVIGMWCLAWEINSQKYMGIPCVLLINILRQMTFLMNSQLTNCKNSLPPPKKNQPSAGSPTASVLRACKVFTLYSQNILIDFSAFFFYVVVQKKIPNCAVNWSVGSSRKTPALFMQNFVNLGRKSVLGWAAAFTSAVLGLKEATVTKDGLLWCKYWKIKVFHPRGVGGHKGLWKQK